MNKVKSYMGSDGVKATLNAMTEELAAYLQEKHIDNPAMIGIHTGGAWVAEYICKKLGHNEAFGTLDISFYRDDLTTVGFNPTVKPSELPFDVDDRHIILIDDVLHTGRTIRAAMNELFDYGRPASITLLVLVEREGRQLPIQADIAGIRPVISHNKHIILSDADTLTLNIISKSIHTRHSNNGE